MNNSMQNSFKSLVICAFLSLIPLLGHASGDPLSSYRSYFDVTPGEFTIPMVLEVPLPVDVSQPLVREQSTGMYVASNLVRTTVPVSNVVYRVTSNTSTDGVRGNPDSLVAADSLSALDLLVGAESASAESSFTIEASAPVGVSELVIDYAQSSASPKTVTVYAPRPDGEEELVARVSSFESRRIMFPERFGQVWRVVFSYDEPVRLTRLSFGPTQYRTVVDTVRFLAQPGELYRVYLDPERPVSVPLRSSGRTDGVPTTAPAYVDVVRANPDFTPADSDADGVPDVQDNCPANPNPDQKSSRGTVRGDVCDDFDNDGVVNTVDNCEFLPNPNQADTDVDGIGDECDKSESRLTEQYPWLPWVGIGITLLVILSLFVSVARRPLPNPEEVKTEEE